MEQNIYGKDYKAAQELKNAGLTPESISAIQDTTVITRDGAQHVVPRSQKHLDENTGIKAENVTSVGNDAIRSIHQQLQDHQKIFSRYKNYSEQRITKLEIALSEATSHLKEMMQVVHTLKSNSQAAQKREEVFTKQNNGGGNVSEKPIDRNNVSPSDVQVEKIFYAGTR